MFFHVILYELFDQNTELKLTSKEPRTIFEIVIKWIF